MSWQRLEDWLRDLAKYQEIAVLFNINILNEKFDLLKEIGNLFVVKPENLKSVIREGHLARIELAVIRPYLELRTDWHKLAKFEKDLLKIWI